MTLCLYMSVCRFMELPCLRQIFDNQQYSFSRFACVFIYLLSKDVPLKKKIGKS